MTATLQESYWPADRSQPVLETNLTAMLRAAAVDVPDRIALIDADPDSHERRTWTYAELLESAERIAQALLRRFIPGERVAIWAPNRPEWVLLQHGLSMAGLIMVTLNPAYRRQELAYVLRQSRSAGVFCSDEYRGFDMTGAVAAARGELPDLREAWSFSDWDGFVATADAGARDRAAGDYAGHARADSVDLRHDRAAQGRAAPSPRCRQRLGVPR